MNTSESVLNAQTDAQKNASLFELFSRGSGRREVAEPCRLNTCTVITANKSSEFGGLNQDYYGSRTAHLHRFFESKGLGRPFSNLSHLALTEEHIKMGRIPVAQPDVLVVEIPHFHQVGNSFVSIAEDNLDRRLLLLHGLRTQLIKNAKVIVTLGDNGKNFGTQQFGTLSGKNIKFDAKKVVVANESPSGSGHAQGRFGFPAGDAGVILSVPYAKSLLDNCALPSRDGRELARELNSLIPARRLSHFWHLSRIGIQPTDEYRLARLRHFLGLNQATPNPPAGA